MKNGILTEGDILFNFTVFDTNESVVNVNPAVVNLDLLESNYFYLDVGIPSGSEANVNIIVEDDFITRLGEIEDGYKEKGDSIYSENAVKLSQFKNKFDKLPEIKIMIRAMDRYKGDVNQQIKVNLSSDKIRSKEELDIEIKRQLPIFLEIINYKRNKENEPNVKNNQIIASAFLDIGEHRDIEISYASEIYIPVMKRLVEESRIKIKELTTWK